MTETLTVETSNEQRVLTADEWRRLYNKLQEQGRPLINILAAAEEFGI